MGAAAWAAVLVVVALAGVASVLVIESGGGVSQPSSTTTAAASTSTASGTSSSSTSSSTSAASTTSTSAKSPENGLQLSLALNSSSISNGQGIAATVVELNTLTTANNVSAAAEWPMGNLAVGPCGHLNQPVGIAVLSGFYDAANVSSGKALQIYQPGTYACPAVLSGISGYLFQASSDNATVLGSCQPGPCFNETIGASVSFSGFWTGSLSASFTNFPSGVYTVVAGDEWGGLAIVHFTVTGTGA